MASARLTVVRGSLALNAVLVLYLSLTRLVPSPNQQVVDTRDLSPLAPNPHLYASLLDTQEGKYEGAVEGAVEAEKEDGVIDGGEGGMQAPAGGLAAPPLNKPQAAVVASDAQLNEISKDLSLGGRRTLEQLPNLPPPPPVEVAVVEPEEPPREVQESVGVTEQLVVAPLAVESPDPPLDSLERKMYGDLRECSTRPLRPFYQQRGDYWVLENYIPAALSFRCDESITYTTHGDYTFLDNLEPLTSRWQGPVSVAVYAPGTDFNATINTILYLRDCWAEGIKKYVTFHLFFHVNHTPKKVPSTEEMLKRKTDCGLEPPKWTNVTTYRQHSKLLYPVNVARNTARQAAQTYFVFASDVELYPSINFIPEFFKMLKRPDVSNTTNPRVFVFSIFEVRENATVPENKVELQKMLVNRNAIPFHKNVCAKCHNVPMSKEWNTAPVKPEMSVFHIGKRKPPFHKWEPIYVGTNKDPVYDERLSWEGKSDKMTQMYILCVRDYEFHILDNAFLVHKPGIKKLHRDAARDKIVAKQNQAIKTRILPEYKTIFGIRKSCII